MLSYLKTNIVSSAVSMGTVNFLQTRLIVFALYTVKPVLSDHIKQIIFLACKTSGCFCCMKVVQKAPLHVLSINSNKQPHVNNYFHVA